VPLSRERILRAALALVDRQGLDALTMRTLGDALSVEAMSLYRYVSGKADVLEGIADRVVGEFELPAPGIGWRAGLRQVADSVWRVTERHPHVTPLLLETPTSAPGALAFAEGVMGLIGRAGFGPSEAHRIYRLTQAYALGSALMFHASPSPKAIRATARLLATTDRYPLLRRALARTRAIDRRADYLAGIDLLLGALAPPRRGDQRAAGRASRARQALESSRARDPADPAS
jgi:AcrR family transcriptional regulator